MHNGQKEQMVLGIFKRNRALPLIDKNDMVPSFESEHAGEAGFRNRDQVIP